MDYIHDIRQKIGHEPIILNFVGGILINDKNEVLLQKHSDMNKWDLPGGAMEYGETVEGTCRREFREETGLEVILNSFLGLSSNHIQRYPNSDVAQAIVTFFLVDYCKGELNSKNNETLDLKYFSKENLPEIFNRQHASCLQHYFEHDFPYFE
ncbi:NUDIX hydrolase [Companilactobacillus kimchii]|uniref:NUDIX hydrolase n=2 Tax=Companilactobacillus kimchii TaxID=2801452 RepID=A0ABR5NRT1_9LACO|nr:NUDIX hydrolase [Companilactobacillus kimchii]KAE9559339.1 NTP pyrophosphohydrolase [Companilactobacillus kimchii]KRK50733.1 NUDIX hydrolase [Companilactobacillus kimchii DSM 13961 = JCM 10707]OWF32491.1 8-oxo-dGTP diphosphatase [Companilactobacillus kimchii]GEO47510.1 NUDIX domain-containing protein [Companilactobacillus paralimentarius]